MAVLRGLNCSVPQGQARSIWLAFSVENYGKCQARRADVSRCEQNRENGSYCLQLEIFSEI
jgi:hypothetical protein